MYTAGVQPRTAFLLVCLGKGTAAIVGMYLSLYIFLPALGFDVPRWLNIELARGATTLLHASGFDVRRADHILTLRGSTLIVTNDCNAIGIWLLLTGAIIAVPRVELLARAAGMLGSAVLLSAFNIVRLAQLTYLNAYRPDWFSVVHEQIVPVVLLLFSVGLYLAWVRLAERSLRA